MDEGVRWATLLTWTEGVEQGVGGLHRLPSALRRGCSDIRAGAAAALPAASERLTVTGRPHGLTYCSTPQGRVLEE